MLQIVLEVRVSSKKSNLLSAALGNNQKVFSMEMFQNDTTNILTLKFLLQPCIPRGKKNLRIRSSPTQFKILTAIYQLRKNVLSKKWEKVAPGKAKIAKTARSSRDSVTRFINGTGLAFFKKTTRFKATNLYDLEPWVVKCFQFFEKKGMMKGIIQDFEKWRKTFLLRINKWLLPLLEKGFSLNDILMNKLSTKTRLMSAYPEPLMSAGIKPSGFALKGNRNNTEISVPSICEFDSLSKQLETELRISRSDVNTFVLHYPLSHHKRAATLALKWMANGIKPDSPVRMYQSCLNKTKQVDRRPSLS